MAEVAIKKPASTQSRTRSIAFVALSIAIIAVSAWITVPIGPIPFTLQMFSLTFVIIALSPAEAMCAIVGYLALGAVGVPVFSGMRGGIGVLAGPTGGFLWGYIFGVALGVGFLYLVRRARGERALTQKSTGVSTVQSGNKVVRFIRRFGCEIIAGVLFTAVSYACGCIQYMAVGGVEIWQAFLVCCAPFIVVDLCKIVAAAVVAEAVTKAVGRF